MTLALTDETETELSSLVLLPTEAVTTIAFSVSSVLVALAAGSAAFSAANAGTARLAMLRTASDTQDLSRVWFIRSSPFWSCFPGVPTNPESAMESLMANMEIDCNDLCN